MDFPQFFQSGLNEIRIATARWRGLALLCKRPDTLRTVRGVNEDLILPATGSTFTDRDVAQHIIQKPFVLVGGTYANGATVLPAKPGVRYLIHAVNIDVRTLVTDTCTGLGVSGVFSGATLFLNLATISPLTVMSYSVPVILDALTDVNTPVLSVSLTAEPAASVINITYAEIGAS